VDLTITYGNAAITSVNAVEGFRMNTDQPQKDLGMAHRLRRAKGRPVRTRSIASRFTPDEEREITRAAESAGKYTAEWARDVLLQAARATGGEGAVFTELVALRMLTSTVLRSVALGEKISGDAYAQILAEVRTGKHEAARDILNQYRSAIKEQ
jgi:hypothetical protein